MKTFDLLQNCTLDNVLQLIHETFIDLATEESPKIVIHPDSAAEEMTELLIAFYKGKRFQKNAQVRVNVHNSDVMDSGGVRRQLFSTSFKCLSSGHLQVFDGPVDRLRPIIKPSNVVSGLLKIIGQVISHSLIMDQVGFPFLSPPIYNYWIGREDVAITFLKNIDVSGQASHALLKVGVVIFNILFIMLAYYIQLNSSVPEKLVDDDSDLQYVEAILNEAGSEVCLEVL